ncbi:MAG: peptide deformylase [Flavobacteriales bacterium]|jgi:peptide deformylase|nr:peptide deformylase [Flavobacteriales bacterium]MDC3394715.1 peptide deformylase [Flavobacteriales bacterium]MDG1349024.1 peptide deformylase [Flavobacteriales bacterium]|tara:strand:+ start:22082 stop:22642 length:561 start_codon:yes stop_codon:yes gene_type:complete
MILPIVAFGAPILRKKCVDITPEYPELETLLANMWETMYEAYGVGLAAPQINKGIRLFLIDTTPFVEDEEETEEVIVKQAFINARIIEETGEEWDFNEGCLSIPEVREDVSRKSTVTIEYMDENFKKYTDTYSGLTARVIQHEYDHIDGVLFTDKLTALRKRMIKGKLMDISKGKVNAAYKMRFAR